MLDQIISHKYQVIKQREAEINSYKNLVKPSQKSMLEALKKHRRSYICEIKLASPSSGVIRKDVDISSIGRIYAPFADAMSVLAEDKYFMGSNNNVRKISQEQACPVLYKDFIVSPLQVFEARYFGADAVLLMLSVLDDKTYQACEKIARALNMSVLCETHNEEEVLRANKLGAQIIGINNRNLANLQIDLDAARRLRPLVHDKALVIAESGFVNHQQIQSYDNLVDGFLIGTSLMRAPRIDLALRELIFGRVKICGLTNAHDARLAYDLGAYYGGLNFSPTSKRQISLAEAKNIISNASLSFGGVFVNQPIDEVLHIAQELRLDFVQLHGDEAKDYIRELRRLLSPDCEIWQALRIKNTYTPDNSNADLILLDTYKPESYGGTGEAFNWSLCKNYAGRKFGLAGGINSHNIRQASNYNPFLLDMASGAEDGDFRQKSSKKLQEIFATLRGEIS